MSRLRAMLLVVLIFTVNTILISADEFMVNPFYAISSYTEYTNVKQNLNGGSNQIYFQWGRLAMNAQGIIQFTNTYKTAISQFDTFTEYGYPGADAMNDYKTRYPEGKAFLSVFFSNADYNNGKNSSVELLNMSEANWEQYIVAPMLQMLNETNTTRKFAFDGVVLDFEGFRDIDDSVGYTTEQKTDLRNKYSSFLSYLKSRLGDKLLVVCVNPSNVVGYYDGYDYNRIGQIADYIILMAYDFQHSTKYTEPDLLAGKIKSIDIPQTQPYQMVKSAVDKLINTYSVDSHRLILGIDLTPTAWVKLHKTINAQSYVYYELRRPYLEDVLKINKAEQYDEITKVSKKSLNREEALALFYDAYSKYGEEFDSVEYYFESPSSLYEKYHSILRDNNLVGISVWRMGIGGSMIWESMISTINKPIDLNQDSKLDIDDLVIFSLSSGLGSNNADLRADINRDGKVDQYDQRILQEHYR